MKNKKILKMLISLPGIVIGVMILINSDPVGNPLLTLFGLVVIGAALYWLYKSWRSDSVIVITEGTDKKIVDRQQHNCFNVYDEKVVFETMLKTEGIPWKCRNDNKYYFIYEKHGKGNLQLFWLPDYDINKIHFSPEEYGNVLTMPMNEKYMNWSDSLMERIAFGVMVGIIVLELIGLVVLGG